MNELKKSSEQDIYLEPKEQIIENTKSVDEHTLAFAQTNEMVMENDKITPMYCGDTDSYYDNSITMHSANCLPLSTWTNGQIYCPGAEVWYKFNPSITAYYTIYTVGSLGMVGYLYDSNSNQLNSDEDSSCLNFKIVHYLMANQTYYIKAKAYGSNTGSFNIAVVNTVFVESVMIDDANVTLNKGETVTLSAKVLPSYATNKTLRWESSDISVVTVDPSTGKITAVGRGVACICAYSQDGSRKSSCCEVVVNVPVESVTVDISERTMHLGTNGGFTATVCPDNANNKLLFWTSSNAEVARVDSATGYVTAKAVGTANIYVTAQDGTGKQDVCLLTVVPNILVEGITISGNTHTMNVGKTAYLSYHIHPSDATNKSVIWCSTNTKVADINSSTGRIVAKAPGTTTVTVTTEQGNFVASSMVTVIIDTVTIKKDGEFNKVVFNSSGKVWHCINHDMIFDENNRHNSKFTARSNQNFFTNYKENDPVRSDTTPKEYTHEEIKLLYAIDPYGVAHYIQRYASELLYINGLESVLGYKDRIFRLLFNREPKYFARTIDGSTWHVITDKSNLSDIVSESEIIFGMHQIYDTATLSNLCGFAVNIAGAAFETSFFAIGALRECIEKIEKTIVRVLSVGEVFVKNELASYTVNPIIESSFEETNLAWAYNFVSLYDDVKEIVDSIVGKANYYCEILNYCAYDTGYLVYVELKNGTKHKIDDICTEINNRK